MSKQLYEEALADVKKLKEVAEDNAKRALMDAVAPRIRDLIETQLLGEYGLDDEFGEVEASGDDLLMDDELGDEAGVPSTIEPPVAAEPLPVPPVAMPGDTDVAADAISVPDEEGKVTLDLDALKCPGPTDEYELSLESVKALGLLLKDDPSPFGARLKALTKQVNTISSTGKLVRETKGYSSALSSLISEVEDMYGHLQTKLRGSSMKDSYESILENHYATLKQLTEQKMKNRNRLSEADITLKLSGVPDELEDQLDNLDVTLITGEEGEEGAEDVSADAGGEEGGDEGGDLDLDDLGGDEGGDDAGDEEEPAMEGKRLSDDTVVEISESMLRREIARMKLLREESSKPPQIKGLKAHGPGKVADGWEDEDLGDPFVDIDLRESDAAAGGDLSMEGDGCDEIDEADGLDEMDQAHPEDGEHTPAAQDDDQSNEPGATVEAARRRLAAEARLQTEAKKKAQAAKKQQKEAQQKGKQAAKKGQKQEAQKQAKKGKQMQEAYNFYARKFNESVARSNKLKGLLEESARKGTTPNGGSARSAAETDNLRTKLAETNLFNAKLIFTNKLLQNESLTKRQKAEVIERLDEARSEREVKLVYESLTKTLQGSASRKLTESAPRGVIGSSSRPARPASSTEASLNEGYEADRWARLAGIVK